MSTEFNYVARLDTSQIMSGLSEIRSQVGMALGGMGGGLSQTNFGGGAAQGVGQMVGAMAGGFGGGGGTFTDPAMAFSPHYGMQGAQTTLAQEGLISGRGGMAHAARMAPPGVSAGEFAFAAMGNSIDRSIQAREAAGLAGASTFFSSAGGLLAGDLAMGMIGAPLGKAIGGRLAGGAGRMIGGVAGGLGAMMLGTEIVGGAISDHYAEVGQVMGVTRELGDIVGSGRGLSRSQQGELGIAARQAAGDIKMDFNKFGDMMALSRDAGMLPSTSDPAKFRQQGAELASAIQEVSEKLHSSTAAAVQVIKNAHKQGLSVDEGIIRAGMDGGIGSMMYGMGAGMGRSMGFTGQQGGQIMSSAYGQAGASGISGEEMRILGGQSSVAALLGGTQMSAVTSPLGNLQMMAARGGGALGGIMDLPGQAMSAMSQGGDFLSNVGKFMVHSDEYRRGIGSSGIRAMASSQLDGMGDVISDLMPGLSSNEAKRMAAMKMYGMSGTQAEAYVGGMGASGGGGDGGYARNLQIAKMADNAQLSRLGRGMDGMPQPEARAEFGMGYAAEGAMFGIPGGPKGMIAGAAAGFAIGNARALWQGAGDVLGEIPHLFDSATEKADRRQRAMDAAYDRSVDGVANKMGLINFNIEDAARATTADLSGVSLSLAGISPRALAMTENAMWASGMTPGAAGGGSFQVGDGGINFTTADLQRRIRGTGGKLLKGSEMSRVIGMTHDAVERIGGRATADAINGAIAQLATEDPQSGVARKLNQNIPKLAMELAGMIPNEADRKAVLQSMADGGFQGNQLAGAFLSRAGVPLQHFADGKQQLVAAIGAAAKSTLDGVERDRTQYFVNAYGKQGLDAEGTERLERLAGMINSDPHTRKAGHLAALGKIREANEQLVLGVKAAKLEMNKTESSAGLIDMDSVRVDREVAGRTFTSESRLEKTTTGRLAKQEPGGSAVRSRAMGFGEHESAMDSINRSLQRTTSMIESLHKKISRGGKK